MYLRLMASALMRHDGKLLMMHRGPHKKILPDFWAVPGGHAEHDEMNDPRLTALRELWEETGIGEEQLSRFDLRYVFLVTAGEEAAMDNRELRMHFVFIGDLKEKPTLVPCDEGTFHWLAPDEVPDRKLAPSIRAMMEHYIPNPDDLRLHMGDVTYEPFSVRWAHKPLGAVAP